MGGGGVARKVGGAGRAAGPILAARAVGRGAGLPAGCAVPVGPLADFGSVVGMTRCGVTRGLGGTGRPAGPIKRKAAFAARWGARYPAACGAPESPLANFGSVGSGAGCVVARKVGGAGRPARPILAAWWAWQGAGLPAVCEVPQT